MRRTRSRTGKASPELRSMLAQHCAKLMVEEGIADYGRALRKAAERFGIRDEVALPRPQEIEQAVREHQRLFAGDRQAIMLQRYRQTAVDAMRFLAEFQPRLVGPVLDGTAGPHAVVTLHVFSDDPDAVLRMLIEHRIPHRTGSRQLQHGPDDRQSYPTIGFAAEDIDIELIVLPGARLRQAPLDRSGERPMERASLPAVESLLAGGRPA